MADIARLSGGRFLVLGRAGMDLYPDPPGTKIEEAVQFSACLGGSSGNIAAALARQGCKVALVTCVSDDAVGRFTRNELKKYGIDDRYLDVMGGEARNTLALSETRLENTQTVIYRNGAADFQLTEDHVQTIDYTNYSGLITTGTGLAAEPSRAATFRAFELASEANVPLIFDIDYRPYSWASAEDAADTYSRAAAACDIIIGNDVEFGFLAGAYDKGLETARYLARNDGKTIVYKMGEQGSVTITRDAEFTSGIYRSEALKPTGAGDSFMGGFVAALAAGRSLEAAVLRGSASAAIVVSRVGCAPAMPTPEELDTFLSGHPGPTSA